MPQYAEGRRIDPTVCVPIAAGTWRAATAAADPDDEPPGVWAADHGFIVGAGSLNANAVATVFPRMTAPASRSRATRAASRTGKVCANAGAPERVGSPATSMMSLTPIGTPCRSPIGRPAAMSASRAAAAASAPSRSTVTHASSAASVASMRSIDAATSSTEETAPVRTATAAASTPRSVRPVNAPGRGRGPVQPRARAASRSSPSGPSG